MTHKQVCLTPWYFQFFQGNITSIIAAISFDGVNHFLCHRLSGFEFAINAAAQRITDGNFFLGENRMRRFGKNQ
jgi:hypothetical protein